MGIPEGQGVQEFFRANYIAVSATNNCEYCTYSHTAAARAKGMSEAQLMEVLAVVGMANETNRLANGLRPPVDPQFLPK